MNIRLNRQKIISLIASLFIMTIILTTAGLIMQNTSAQTQGRVPTPPTFPRCEDKLRVSRGDRLNKNSGRHPIPGKEDFEGRNDIYTLTEGNFVQCSCESNGSRGLQTNWWNIQGLPLGLVDIDAFERGGWVHVTNGANWNVLNNQYLAKTNDINCTTTSASTATPTRSATASRTPTPRNTAASSCTNLIVVPTRGKAPLTVQFTINGNDPNGQIQEYEFDTGDILSGEEQIIKQTSNSVSYTYENPGTYKVVAWIKDSQENWRESNACKKTVTVTDATGKGGVSEELPETGTGASVLFGMIILGEVGYLLYKRYQLI
jgi:hypothetical protein